MESFLALPEDLLILLIEDWIGNWKDVVSFDTALCNKLQRTLFHSCLRNRSPVIGYVPYELAVINFMKQRGLRISCLKVGQRHFYEDDLHQVDLRNITKIYFELPEDKSCDFVDRIICRCKTLKVLEVAKLGYKARTFASSYFGQARLLGLPFLMTLKLSYLQTFNDQDLLSLIHAAPNLQQILIYNCSCISGNGILAAVSTLTDLKTLHTTRIEPISFEPLLIPPIKSTATCPLQHIVMHDVHLPREYWYYLIRQHAATISELVIPALRLSDEELLDICKTLPLLEYLDFRCCTYISPKKLLIALSHCCKLKSVRVNAACTDITVRPFADMSVWKMFVEKVPSLVSIHFGNMIKLCDDVLKLLCASYEQTLQYISILQTQWVTDTGMESFLTAPPGHIVKMKRALLGSDTSSRRKILPYRKHLVVSEVPGVSSAMLRHIQKHSNWSLTTDMVLNDVK